MRDDKTIMDLPKDQLTPEELERVFEILEKAGVKVIRVGI